MPNDTELSEREREILRLAATGASNKEIAQELFISTNTVKVHLRNVFAKIGVASRTEATLYAIRKGIAPPPAGTPITTQVEFAALTGSQLPTEAGPASEAPRPRASRLVMVLLTTLALLTAAVLGFTLLRPAPAAVTAIPSPQPTLSRWKELAPLPEGRAGLAAAVYEGQVFAIAGETNAGVSGSVTRYDPTANTWTSVASKPVAVADVGAALLGERVYVPGGRLSNGEMTNLLEVYDPRRDSWEVRAPLPVPVSAYALAVSEGRLYLFGGTDGTKVLGSVYEYDPVEDAWQERTSMPTARSFSGAAAVGGKIFVIGGWDGEKALAVNEVYYPRRDGAGESPWEEKASLPEGRFGMGVAGLAENIYVVGGSMDKVGESCLQSSQSTAGLIEINWVALTPCPVQKLDSFVFVQDPLSLVIIGGRTGIQLASAVYSFNILYTVSFPVVR